jgi:nucleoside-diphosphate-sugar epimerase
VKILLTGASGFIGSELLKDLSQKHKLYITLRKNINYKSKNIKVLKFKDNFDLNKKLRNIKIDAVIHCATHYVKNHKFEDLKKLSDSNILFGNIILENLENMNTKIFINFSTVWEDYNRKKNNFYNLYSAYKRAFKSLITFYKNKFFKIKFFDIVISDTFGENDRRKKIINIMRSNYQKNLTTKIISKNLYINLLNVLDINRGIKLILKKNYKSGTYLFKNNKFYSLFNIVNFINNKNKKKIKVKWISNVTLKEKFYRYKALKNWKPIKSNISDIAKVITG